MRAVIGWRSRLVAIVALAGVNAPGAAQDVNRGPYNVRVLEGGIGIERDLTPNDPLREANASLTMSAWVRPERHQAGFAPVIAQGWEDARCRCLGLRDGRPAFRAGKVLVSGALALPVGRWSHVAATFDGATIRLFVAGRQVALGRVHLPAVSARIGIAPVAADLPGYVHYGGSLAEARLEVGTAPLRAIEARVAHPPDFDLVQFNDVGVGWEFQKRANTGLWEQQDAWTLPQAKTAPDPPRAVPVAEALAVEAFAPSRWRLNGWRMREAPALGAAGGAMLSRPGVDTAAWYAATVPGTALTTLVDRGRYPDPYRGLNNLAIPESLARQDYWYRTAFQAPADAKDRRTRLRLNGVNYAAEVWLNGTRVGRITGAFIRGDFDVTLVPGENVLAVRVSPPPHPGIPHEQSIAGGVGENGGQLAIDGPTFVATEGWDWIPGIRDRNTGLWQPVELAATGDVRLLDPHVVTDLPLPRTDAADIYLTVPVENLATAPRRASVTARFGDVTVVRDTVLPPGKSELRFTPADFPQLHFSHPRLWWPNGYGDPALYDLTVTVEEDGRPSDETRLRFGIRELSYELSLFDGKGALRRVDVHTTDGSLRGERLIDVRHEAIKRSPLGWAASLTKAGEHSPAVRDVAATMALPHLTLRVNGVPIAVRGGNWGMDDAMKRIGRDRLAPYFRLQREAHMNVIRNWMGNNDEPAFFDLADENGMLVLNDFWQSTQDFQIEPQDPALFLANARDTISRYRNHPSIALWFGRNEGVPYPALNEGLDDLVAELDGTRWFNGSSNVVNLQGSGPYNYRPPEGYFTDLASGFSVETGTPSLSTIDSIRRWVPEADRWPLSDTLAYHDWHFAGNGDTKTFMSALDTMSGAPTDLADFEAKAQMLNLETHQAMYEGFLGHLWRKNSGRLLWMTHPSWPSNAWQLYSWDYDTSAAYYGAKRAARPVHAQLNRPDETLVVVNTTRQALPGLTVRSSVFDLTGAQLFERTDRIDAAANASTPAAALPLHRLFASRPMLLIAMELRDRQGRDMGDTFYWRGAAPAAYRALERMAEPTLVVTASAARSKGEDRVRTFTLQNSGTVPALNAKITLFAADGTAALPAFFSDNYVALLPGQTRQVEVRYPAAVAPITASLRVWRGRERPIALP